MTISEEEAREIRLALLKSRLSRSLTAARAIEVALISGSRVVLKHAERLAVLEVLRKRPEPLRDELALLDAALAASPLDKEYGSDGEMPSN